MLILLKNIYDPPTFMSSTVSTATPAIPTSPGTLGLSESYLNIIKIGLNPSLIFL